MFIHIYFQNTLITLIKENPLTRNCLQVISIPPLPVKDENELWRAVKSIHYDSVQDATDEMKKVYSPRF